MAKIIATAGLPRSGKSSWCAAVKQFCDLIGLSCEIVCRDDIRKEDFGVRYDSSLENKVLETEQQHIEFFAFCVDIILIDGCHHTKEARERILDIGESLGCSVEFVLIDTTTEECIARAAEVEDYYIIPVIKKKAKEWENLD